MLLEENWKKKSNLLSLQDIWSNLREFINVGDLQTSSGLAARLKSHSLAQNVKDEWVK